MFGGCCCYCEGDVVSVDYGDIEHRLPKCKFHDKTFEWENLFFACGKCNTEKKKNFNLAYPILDVCSEEPNDHFFYKKGYFLKGKTERGKKTINFFCKLNRDQLLKARMRVYEDGMSKIRLIKQFPKDNKERNKAIKQIRKSAKHGNPFCSVYRHIISKNIDIFSE
jgi:hypothetical protein